jgi:hypothetical protein
MSNSLTPTATIASLPNVEILPARGGAHVLHGVYIGGGKIGDDWTITNPRYRYRSVYQLKGDKWISKIESRLISRRDDASGRKFNGKLENAGDKEMDKDEFVRAAKSDIRAHGHEGLYAIQSGGHVVDLLDHLHEFTVDEVIKSSTSRINSTIKDALNQYELDEIETSRLVIESLLSPTLTESLQTRFDHDSGYFYYPGNVLLMMVLEVCNASVSYDIEGAQEKNDSLKLDEIQGEDISAFGAEVQKQVKVIQTEYALLIRTGSKYLSKLTSTSCERMHRKVYALFDDVKDVEDHYKLSDPRAITLDKSYSTLGSIGLIAWSQKLHATFVADHDWPALATKFPSANVAITKSTTNSDATTSDNQKKRACLECGSANHMRPFCPKLKAKRDAKQNKDKDASSSVAANSATDKKSKPSKTDHDSVTVHPLADWKYIEPKDNTKKYPDSKSKAWKWCSQCKCIATGRQGIMQLSNFEKNHVDGFRQSKPTGMLASVADPDQGVPLSPPTFTTVEPDNEDEDQDGLVFTGAGMWHCEVSYGSDIRCHQLFLPLGPCLWTILL